MIPKVEIRKRTNKPGSNRTDGGDFVLAPLAFGCVLWGEFLRIGELLRFVLAIGCYCTLETAFDNGNTRMVIEVGVSNFSGTFSSRLSTGRSRGRRRSRQCGSLSATANTFPSASNDDSPNSCTHPLT